MAKWIFAPLVLLSIGAQANGLAPSLGSCVVLDQIIYEDVTASGWGMTGADLVFTNFREPSVVVCTSTAQRHGNAGEARKIDSRSRQANLNRRRGADQGPAGSR